MSKFRVFGRTNLKPEQEAELESKFGVQFFETNVVEEEYPNIHQAVAERIGNAEVIGVNMLTPINRDTLDQCPSIRRIVAYSSGINHIDVEYCQSKEIDVRSAHGYCSRIVAEKTICFMMLAMYKILPAIDNFKEGHWDYLKFRGRELQGKRLVIVGFGSIGKIVGELALGLGMNVFFIRSNTTQSEILSLLQTADILSLHIPLTKLTSGWLGARYLAQLRRDSIVINTSRGGVVDELALVEFLTQTPTAMAFLDVLNEEPPASEHPIRELSNAVVTPHITWHSEEADARLASFLYEEMKEAYQDLS